MTPVTTPPAPGSLTVPPWFGWEHVATVLMLVVILAIAAFVLLAAGKAGSGRSEWQALLDARSRRYQDPAADPHDPSAQARAGLDRGEGDLPGHP
jgi:hypothetical protein